MLCVNMSGKKQEAGQGHRHQHQGFTCYCQAHLRVLIHTVLDPQGTIQFECRHTLDGQDIMGAERLQGQLHLVPSRKLIYSQSSGDSYATISQSGVFEDSVSD